MSIIEQWTNLAGSACLTQYIAGCALMTQGLSHRQMHKKMRLSTSNRPMVADNLLLKP